MIETPEASLPRIQRRETPSVMTGMEGYRRAKEFLRRDFARRCAYCTIHENQTGGVEHFWIDHFHPLSAGGERNDYHNLYWSCIGCNHIKGGRWPSAVERSLGYRFADPCKEQDYGFHFYETDKGYLISQTSCGEYHLARLLLNRPSRLRYRKRKIELQMKINHANQLLAETIDTANPDHLALIRSLILQFESDIADL